jgi:hypothetical protein
MSSVRTLIAAALLLLTASAAQAHSFPKIAVPPDIEGRAAALASHVGPRTRTFIAKEGADQAAKGPSFAAVAASIKTANLGSLNAADIDALAFLVLMQAADDQERDLQTVMAAVKATHGRGPLPAARYAPNFTLTGLSNGGWSTAFDNDKQQIDSMSELSETTSLRLQMAMDRLSKLMETLSNLEKKVSSTNDAILQNLK